MLTVFDVEADLPINPSDAHLLRLKHSFKTLSINSLGLDRSGYQPGVDRLSFCVYGELGQFMMKKMVLECMESVFPGSVVDLFERSTI